MESFHREIIVEDQYEGERLDAFLGQALAKYFSRTKIKKLINSGDVRVEKREVSAHYRVKMGEKIDVHYGEVSSDQTRAENIPLDIIAEDEDYVIVNKPAGMVVHPAHANPSHTLVNALLYHIRNLSASTDQSRPGIVHRLDKDTSGIMVIAKNDIAHRYFAERFKSHQIEKTYHTFVKGIVEHDENVCEEPVGRAFLNRKKIIVRPSGGKSAVTFFRVTKRFNNVTLLEVKPRTGRTHQIRVHMAYMGHPLLGDSLYGVRSQWIERQALHAYSLSFLHPKTRKRMTYVAPWPKDLHFLQSQLEASP